MSRSILPSHPILAPSAHARLQVTPTHFDGFENLLVVVSGTKRLWLYPPSDARHLYCAGGTRKEPSRATAPPFQTHDEMQPEMQRTFPEVAHARPLEVRLDAGDFLYLPACWWHCVEGSRERNMIINWWFAVHPRKRGYEGDFGAPPAAGARMKLAGTR